MPDTKLLAKETFDDFISVFTFRMVLFFVLLGLSPFIYEFYKGIYLDPRDLYTYRGTSGPYTVESINGVLSVNKDKPISKIKAGDYIGWETTLCTRSDVSAVVHNELINDTTKKNTAQIDIYYKPGFRECGAANIIKLIPLDTPPGSYSILRSILLTPPSGTPRSAATPPINIEVLP